MGKTAAKEVEVGTTDTVIFDADFDGGGVSTFWVRVSYS